MHLIFNFTKVISLCQQSIKEIFVQNRFDNAKFLEANGYKTSTKVSIAINKDKYFPKWQSIM
ncbi:MAG TPA: hypothetical protein DCM62_07015 [Bacteroidales bacterium]|nr:hypothetical protein [Bacteroidales bacterium]